MGRTIYHNNDVEITLEKSTPEDPKELKVNVNGQNLIWISAEAQDDFRHDLAEVLDKYRI
jgi:hypothetical protein